MIEDLFAKWRGTDHWIETEATVYSSVLIADSKYDDGPPSTRLVFYYLDQRKSVQSGELIVDSLTSLFSLQPKDTFRILFNPQKPARFYCAEAASLFTQFKLAIWIGVPTVLIVVTVILLLHLLQSSHVLRP